MFTVRSQAAYQLETFYHSLLLYISDMNKVKTLAVVYTLLYTPIYVTQISLGTAPIQEWLPCVDTETMRERERETEREIEKERE